MDRRTFQLGMIYGLWSFMAAVLALPAAVYLLWPPNSKKETEWEDVGSLSQLGLKLPQEIVFRRNRIDGWKIISEKVSAWVVKMSDKDVIAYGPQCPHLGCAYHWVKQKNEFLCPCHTSTFSIEGDVLSGPAPRPLDRYEVKLQGDKLLLGPIRKSTESAT
ncbi:MAG: ubiquinol-cytochrome c reductase iron-sulfur subunit [Terriglobia bacterium]